MKISEVCIRRPVLATVMSLVILLFGSISLTRLQNRYLPNIDPPVVSVTTVYPGAAPEVVETSVTDPIEEQVNGIDGVKNVTSVSREQVSLVTVEFDLDRDLEAATNDVRDRVARAIRDLPEEAEDPVVAKRDSDARPILWMALSGDGHDPIALTQMADKLLVDRMAKLPGVASVVMFGERRYSMRVWLDNHLLHAQSVNVADVANALRRQNVDIPSGRLESADTEFTVRSLGELQSPEEFGNLVIKSFGPKLVRLRDVGRVEVGAESLRKQVHFNGKAAVGVGVVKQSNANTIDVVNGVRAILDELRSELPPGVEFVVAYDSSKFIRQSIRDVSQTIFQAAILVILVIYVFLRSFRATFVPAIAIPVSVLGSFTFLYMLGFTLNTLTLMGVTLAIGLVVDDAIVVLENISRWIEDGTPALEAAQRGMQEISFAVVAATVSAVAVFLPLTFLTDETGRLFREFAVVVASALAVSGFVAVTLSPALCALVLRPKSEESNRLKRAFAAGFDRLAEGYRVALASVLRRPGVYVSLGGVWVGLGVVLLFGLPEELIPSSDRSVFFVVTDGPEGSTLDYMDRYQTMAEEITLAQPEVERSFSIIALGIGAPPVVNRGLIINGLVDPGDRDRSASEIADEIGPDLEAIPGIKVYTNTPPALGSFLESPVAMAIQGEDLVALAEYGEEIERRMLEVPGIDFSTSNLFLNKPQMDIVIDRERAGDLGVSVRDVAATLQILLGGLDLSTFKLGGETYDVIVQVEESDRDDPRDMLEFTVRGNDGALISLSPVIRQRETIAPREIPHYNRRRAVTVSSNLEDGFTQGEAIRAAERIAKEVLPAEGYQTRWTGEAQKFLESGNALLMAYALAVLVVYLVLAAQFESFVDPLVILMAVAYSFTGALVALGITRLLEDRGLIEISGTLNLFSKIGMVMLVGLVTKNSILIVEFANQLRGRGLGLIEAVEQAARNRFRPILMTSLATIVGVLPIALGLGAGGASRAPMGIAVAGGMVFSTLLTFFFVPATYVVVARVRARSGGRPRVGATEPAPAGGS
ncbi:MAG: efflux RND transporter permease subunit [Myxococcota bacterium]|nr:efflux RND transporter permease subunit [Myxococcota bacterium]